MKEFDEGLKTENKERLKREKENRKKEKEHWKQEEKRQNKRDEKYRKELNEKIGRFTGWFGNFVKGMVEHRIIELFSERGIELREIHKNGNK